MAAVTDYTDLVTSQHATRPNFMAMVAGVLQGAVDQNNFVQSLVAEFDIDSARWQELDAIGVWVGLDRNLRALTPGIFVPAPPVGAAPLNDADFQVLLHGKIGANRWDGTISGAYAELLDALGSGSLLFMIDNLNMSMIIAVAGAVPDLGMQSALSGGYMQVRPAGVQAQYAFPTAPGGPLFGFGVENQFIAGFGVGVWANII